MKTHDEVISIEKKRLPNKCGKVVFVGEPNVGKSSLLNALVGEKVSIVTDMPGTTREMIRGFLTGEGWQITFLDTPGMDSAKNAKNRDALTKFMGKNISGAVAEADVICYVLDAGDIRDEYIQKIENHKNKKQIIVVVNKVDKTNFEKLYPKLEILNKLNLTVVPVSALTHKSLDILIKEIIKLLPEGKGEAELDDDEYTDQSVKKMCSEIIRGELIKQLRSEIPHGIAVRLTAFRESTRDVEIDADIICNKSGHKPIIIGKGGAVLKIVGTEARKKIEELIGKHVRLNTHVLVREKWREEKDFKKYLNSES